MPEISDLAIPLGVVVSITVQLVKFFKLPAITVQAIVLLSSLILAFALQYQVGLYESIVQAILTAGVAFMTYETVIKKV